MAMFIIAVINLPSVWAGGRRYICSGNYRYKTHYRRGNEFNKNFNRALGTTLGVASGIVAVRTVTTILDGVFCPPPRVVVRRRYYPCSTYSRAYEEELQRLRWREFQRRQQLERQRGRRDAYRDYYGQ